MSNALSKSRMLCSVVILIALIQGFAHPARGQQVATEAPLPAFLGADVISGSIPSVANFGGVDGIRAYAFSSSTCNVGTQELNWFGTPDRRHPVLSQHLYRLKDGRFEQIGQSWARHFFCALQQALCEACQPSCNGCCDRVGVGCSTTNSAPGFGQWQNLGPKSEIHSHLGTNLGVYERSEGPAIIRGRLQVHEVDILPALNEGALFFVEVQYIAEDDAQTGDWTGDNNNASWRQVQFTGSEFIAGFPGGSSTHREEIAMHAWQNEDFDVTLVNVDIPGEGRLVLGYRVTDNGDGTWHYEYALHNLNSDRSVGSFTVPVPDDVGVAEPGFHDVDYHSGEPYSLDDWGFSVEANDIRWTTVPFDQDENANALRWGTLYNFRFDADTPPMAGEVTLGLFKPGAPGAVTAATLVPSPACPPPAFLPGVPGVSFGERAFDGYVDARAESTDGVNVDLGLDEVTVVFNVPLENLDGSPLSAEAFTVTDTAGGAPAISGIVTTDGRTVTIQLADHITLQQWTTIGVLARAQCDASSVIDALINVGYLPADVDQGGAVTPFDLLTFRQYVNETAGPPAGVLPDYVDTDRSGNVSPFDLLAYRQLVNGIPPATRAWSGETLPPRP